MYVGLKMMKNIVSITPKTLLWDAHNLMEEQRLWILPVVQKDKLVGYVNKEDVREALPSQATMLSRHELHTALSEVTVEDLVIKDVITVTPETEIEEAAEIMDLKNLLGFPVVDSKNKLVGYIDRTIMLEVLVEEMGLHRGGKRFAIEFKDRPGVMAEVSGIISDMGINFLSAASFYHKDACILVFRIQTDDIEPVIEKLKDRDYTIVGPEFFKDEWS